jgi:hypothetical protein
VIQIAISYQFISDSNRYQLLAGRFILHGIALARLITRQ